MKTLYNKIKNFTWSYGNRTYSFNWPYIIIVGSGFLVIGLLSHFGNIK